MKKANQVLSMFLVFIFVLSAIPFTVAADGESFTEGYYTYTVTDGKATITDADDAISGDITVPSELGGYPVTSIDKYALSWKTNVTSIIIPGCITSIGNYAFEGFDSNGDGYLLSITVDESNTNYSSYEGVLFNKTQLLCFPSGKSGAYVIPGSVTSIAEGAFSECSDLTSVTIPNGVLSIGSNAFLQCFAITSIAIPSSIISIGQSAFCNCWKLSSFTVEADNTNFKSTDGVLFDKSKTTLIAYPCGKTGTYTIPDSVLRIGDYAFDMCNNLTNVSIPKSVTSIGELAFGECRSLKSIFIPDSVISIGNNAFIECCELTNITIPDSVTSIGDYAFCMCEKLKSVSISSKITEIGFGVFRGCIYLTSITIPDKVTNIGYEAFGGCSSLTTITIPESVINIEDDAFSECSHLSTVIIINNILSIGKMRLILSRQPV